MVNNVKTPSKKDYQTIIGATYTIHSLKPWHSYEVRIACVSTASMGPVSDAQIFRTCPSGKISKHAV
jgi:hypothetical protein